MMEQSASNTISPTSDERMMGALAHFFGILASLMIYAVQKDRSRFVRFQAAQALAFDLAVMLFMFLLFFCLFGVMFLGMFGTILASLNSASGPEDFTWLMVFPVLLPWVMVSCIFPFSFAILIARTMAAVSVFNGNDFRYPFLGGKVAQFLTD
jgi:uncharacterized Tic20 family protein